MTEILCITHKYPPTIGGMEKQSLELTQRLSQHYHVHLIAYEGEGNKALWFWRLKSQVKRLLAEHPSIKLIHLNDGLMAAACTWLQTYTDIPVIPTYHGLDITFPSKIFQKKILPRLTRYTAGICVSHATKERCIERGFATEHTHVVLNGVDHDMATMPYHSDFRQRLRDHYGIDTTDKKIIMTMGRPVRRKGFSWFLEEVFPKLSEDIIFVMVGPLATKASTAETFVNMLPRDARHKVHLLFGMPSDREAVIDGVQRHDRVHHLGKLAFAELVQMLSAADLFVMPNIHVDGDAEGFGLVALEASMRGTPVVASGIEGITDAVRDGKNGILLPSKDIQAWVRTLEALLDDEEDLEKRSRRAQQYTLEQYSWDKMTEGYRRVFEQYMK